MSREEGADLTEATGSLGGTTTLVLGEGSHDAPCRRLAGARPGGASIRMTTSEASGVPCANTDDQYEVGVYDGLDYPDAGIAVSEAIANLDHGGDALDDNRPVVCVDGLPRPSGFAERQRLFRFLHAVTRRIRNDDGRCHVHLRVDPDAEVVDVVGPLFEDVVDATRGTKPAGP